MEHSSARTLPSAPLSCANEPKLALSPAISCEWDEMDRWNGGGNGGFWWLALMMSGQWC
jgi:hypothetical protein